MRTLPVGGAVVVVVGGTVVVVVLVEVVVVVGGGRVVVVVVVVGSQPGSVCPMSAPAPKKPSKPAMNSRRVAIGSGGYEEAEVQVTDRDGELITDEHGIRRHEPGAEERPCGRSIEQRPVGVVLVGVHFTRGPRDSR